MLNSKFKKDSITTIAIVCVAACIIDIALLYVFGKQIPGYNQLTDSISSMGISASPVSKIANTWSVTLGIVFILFSFGFREAFQKYSRNTNIAFWLIIIYGLGEGIASGLIKADHINGIPTATAVFHDISGGIGVTAILLLPLLNMKIFSMKAFPAFFRFSFFIWIISILSNVLFLFRIDYFEHTFLYSYSGLWQRIFLVTIYVYFSAIAIMIVKEANKINRITQ
jgi:hypothetical protein